LSPASTHRPASPTPVLDGTHATRRLRGAQHTILAESRKPIPRKGRGSMFR